MLEAGLLTKSYFNNQMMKHVVTKTTYTFGVRQPGGVGKIPDQVIIFCGEGDSLDVKAARRLAAVVKSVLDNPEVLTQIEKSCHAENKQN